jgi:hypothetical protein
VRLWGAPLPLLAVIDFIMLFRKLDGLIAERKERTVERMDFAVLVILLAENLY